MWCRMMARELLRSQEESGKAKFKLHAPGSWGRLEAGGTVLCGVGGRCRGEWAAPPTLAPEPS